MFQCCSLEMNSDTLSIIGATLANGGICPLSEEKVLRSESVRDVLSLMHSCGMYDYSGQFAFKVTIVDIVNKFQNLIGFRLAYRQMQVSAGLY